MAMTQEDISNLIAQLESLGELEVRRLMVEELWGSSGSIMRTHVEDWLRFKEVARELHLPVIAREVNEIARSPTRAKVGYRKIVGSVFVILIVGALVIFSVRDNTVSPGLDLLGSEGTSKGQIDVAPQKKANAQNPGEHTENKPPKNTQQDTRPGQEPSQQTEGKQRPQTPGDKISGRSSIVAWFSNVMKVLFTISFAAILGGVKLYWDWIKDRAYLSVKLWEIEEVLTNRKLVMTITIENTGKTPAKLYARAFDCDLFPYVPVQFDPAPSLKTIKRTELSPGNKLQWTMPTPHLGTLQMSRMEGRRGDPLLIYAALYVEFNRFLWWKRWVLSEVIYDTRTKKLRAVTEADRHDDYDKK